MNNQEIARILENIADLLELQQIPFKPQAYRNAARTIVSLPEKVEDVYIQGKLEELPGIGESIAKKIAELIKTGKLKYYQRLKKETQVEIDELKQIPTLGFKKIQYLHKELGIKNLDDLEKAIQQNKLQNLTGFKEKSILNLLKGIQLVKNKIKRFSYSEVKPIVKFILDYFKPFKFVEKIEVVGSFRRKKATIGDLDFLIVTKKAEEVIDKFVQIKGIKNVLVKGKVKASILLKNNLQVDLRIFKKEEFGAALLYFIGDKQFNIKIRKIALSKGYTLNEYGLYDLKSGKKVAGENEEQIFKKLGLKYLQPEERNT